MKINHIAIWTNDLEKLRAFYQKYFEMKCGNKYVNVNKGFSSYFLSFENGPSIEIMTREDIENLAGENKQTVGFAHIAISVGEKALVDILTERLRLDGYRIKGNPRTTGDGFYESVILDPDGNHIEITE